MWVKALKSILGKELRTHAFWVWVSDIYKRDAPELTHIATHLG